MIMLGGGAFFLKDLGPDYFGLMLLSELPLVSFQRNQQVFLG